MTADVIGMVVGLEDALDAHAPAARELQVLVDLEARIDPGGRTGLVVTDEIRGATEVVA